MRLALTFAFVGLSGVATAQTLNHLDLYSGVTVATSRGDLGSGAGELLQRFTAQHFEGIGDRGAGALIDGVEFVGQDQDGSTPETAIVLIRQGSIAGPDPTSGGVIVQTPPVMLPGGSGVRAFQVQVSFATPVVVPDNIDLFPGLQLTAAPSWPNDGVSLHFCSIRTIGGIQSDLARLGAPNWAWQVDNSSVPSQPAQRHWRVGFLVQAPTFNVGNLHNVSGPPSPAFGLGGCFPDVSAPRRDGLAFKAQDVIRPGGRAWVFLSSMFVAPYNPVPTILGGQIYLDPVFVTELTSFPLDANGDGQQNTIPQGTLPTVLAGAGLLPFQALTADRTLASCAMSNGFAVCF